MHNFIVCAAVGQIPASRRIAAGTLVTTHTIQCCIIARIPSNGMILQIILMESSIINEMNFSICRRGFWLKVIAVAELFITNDSVGDAFRKRRKFILFLNETFGNTR